jgi:hypothetical protein
MAPSIPWFAAIQGIKSKKDLAGLAPKGSFISAEAVECVVGQIGESQKATRELGGGMLDVCRNCLIQPVQTGHKQPLESLGELGRAGLAQLDGRPEFRTDQFP